LHYLGNPQHSLEMSKTRAELINIETSTEKTT